MRITVRKPLTPPPAWALLIPAGVALIAWLMRKRTPLPPGASTVRPGSTPTPASSSTSTGSALPRVSGASWVTPARGMQYEPLFLRESARHGLPPGLLSRQAWRESNYNPAARSHAGALGIMQIIPRWHPSIDPGDAAADAAAALDPNRAIPYAAKLLRQLFNQFGAWSLALAAYNAGPTIVARYGLEDPANPSSRRLAPGGIPPYAETRNYVATILPAVGITESGVRYA